MGAEVLQMFGVDTFGELGQCWRTMALVMGVMSLASNDLSYDEMGSAFEMV